MKPTAWPISLALLNAIAFVAMVTVNGLANSLPINGKTTGELSDSYPNLFVPAGFTFAIWGVIYLLLLAFVVYQIAVVFRGAPDGTNAVQTIHLLFVASSLANVAWIYAWHYERVFLSLVLMLALAAALVAIYLRLQIGLAPSNTARRWLVEVPFGVYLGWITVATVANATAWLVDIGWNGFGVPEAAWAAIVIVVAATIGMLMLARRGDIAYVLVVIWALFGIFMKRIAGGAGGTTVVAVTAAACGVVLVVAVGYRLVRGQGS